MMKRSITTVMFAILQLSTSSNLVKAFTAPSITTRVVRKSTALAMNGNAFEKGDKGKILVLGGSGTYCFVVFF